MTVCLAIMFKKFCDWKKRFCLYTNNRSDVFTKVNTYLFRVLPDVEFFTFSSQGCLSCLSKKQLFAFEANSPVLLQIPLSSTQFFGLTSLLYLSRMILTLNRCTARTLGYPSRVTATVSFALKLNSACILFQMISRPSGSQLNWWNHY